MIRFLSVYISENSVHFEKGMSLKHLKLFILFVDGFIDLDKLFMILIFQREEKKTVWECTQSLMIHCNHSTTK